MSENCTEWAFFWNYFLPWPTAISSCCLCLRRGALGSQEGLCVNRASAPCHGAEFLPRRGEDWGGG